MESSELQAAWSNKSNWGLPVILVEDAGWHSGKKFMDFIALAGDFGCKMGENFFEFGIEKVRGWTVAHRVTKKMHKNVSAFWLLWATDLGGHRADAQGQSPPPHLVLTCPKFRGSENLGQNRAQGMRADFAHKKKVEVDSSHSHLMVPWTIWTPGAHAHSTHTLFCKKTSKVNARTSRHKLELDSTECGVV